MLSAQQEETPVKQRCDNCSFYGKMKIKRGKRVIIYCPQCGKVIYRRYVH